MTGIRAWCCRPLLTWTGLRWDKPTPMTTPATRTVIAPPAALTMTARQLTILMGHLRVHVLPSSIKDDEHRFHFRHYLVSLVFRASAATIARDLREDFQPIDDLRVTLALKASKTEVSRQVRRDRPGDTACTCTMLIIARCHTRY